MRAVVFPGDRTLEVTERPDPVPGPGEVRVALRAASICGSDLHGYRTPSQQRRSAGLDTVVPGHEPAGVVDAVGQGVTNVAEGDRVGVYHYRGCGFCPDCRAGRLQWCPQRRGYGGAVDGSFADLLITDACNCLPLPEDISFVTAAMLMCVGGTAFESLRKLDLRSGDWLAVFGLGPVGLAALRFARATGVRVVGIDNAPDRRTLAADLGAEAVVDAGGDITAEDVAGRIAEITGTGADGALETSGATQARTAAVAAAARGACLVFVGFGAPEAAINPADLIQRQLTLRGSFVFPLHGYDPMLAFVRHHGEDLESIVTHRVPLEAAPEVIPLCDAGRTGKAVFVWE